jgi:hypothetical protein
MPDPMLIGDPGAQMYDHERYENPAPPSGRPPIHDTGYHEFQESEFPNGAGRCDTCGGGPDAEIHHKPVDPLERIATALEEIAGAMHRQEDRAGEALERIASVLEKLMAMAAEAEAGQ